MHTKVPALSIFLNTSDLLSSKKKKADKTTEKKGHQWKGSCEAPQRTHIQRVCAIPAPSREQPPPGTAWDMSPLQGRQDPCWSWLSAWLGSSVMGANSPGMVCDPTWGEEPSRGSTSGPILGMSFVEVLCNSRLNQTGCVSLAGLGGHGERHGSHRVTQPWLQAPEPPHVSVLQ